MTDRIIDLAERPAKLSLRLEQLVLQPFDADPVTIPIEEVAVLIGSQRQLVYTNAMLVALARYGGICVMCDENQVPAAMMIPLQSHHVQTERFARQANASLPTCKRLWQQIVQAKIRAQARTLKTLRGDDHGLLALVPRVRSGDPSNVEAQAARRYWSRLFDRKEFRRDRDAKDENRMLNYGYAVLRAMTTRAICAAGLHPAIGFHHHNRYNSFPLADDLMEPFRPLVDHAVVLAAERFGASAKLDKEVKGDLFMPLVAWRYEVEGEARTLSDILRRAASSLAQVYAGERKDLAIPD